MLQTIFTPAVAAMSASLRFAPLVLAQQNPELKNNFGSGLGVIFMVGFFWGVINIWTGADKMKRGDQDGKMGIVSGIIIAAAASIMGFFYTIFGMADGVIAPKF